MTAIGIKHLTKTFGGLHAIDDLSIDIPRGITTGLIGPNGSGKTTLMNLIFGTLIFQIAD
ncbi:MAG: ATP-binding cassette domain-containing protein [Alphaproteobacteria bacterium]|jgi:ABC-type branched-subunit amino acid transport system ATPase component